MLTAQPFAATPRTDLSVSGSSHSPSLENKPEASHSVSHSATGPSPGDGCQPGIRRKKEQRPREGWEDGTPPPHRDFKRSVLLAVAHPWASVRCLYGLPVSDLQDMRFWPVASSDMVPPVR